MRYSKPFRILAAIAAMIGPGCAAAQQQPPTALRIDALLQNVRLRAATASEPYAAALAGNRDSPEYTAMLRASLNAAYRTALTQESLRSSNLFRNMDVASYQALFGRDVVRTTPERLPQLSAFDLDPRYRQNFSLLIRGGDAADRVWNGLPTTAYENTVAIVSGTRICTGTVIGRNAVLTAQHCHCRGVNERVFVGSVYDPRLPSFRVTRSVPMRACGDAQSDPADTAVLFVDGEFPASVQAARLATPAQIDAARIVRAVGFGLTETGDAGRKMMVDIPIASSACNGTVSPPGGGTYPDTAYYGCNGGYELVAGSPSLDRDTCNGDSGGPVFIVDEQGGEWLAGATSRAVTRAETIPGPELRGCGDGGIYVRIDGPVRTWLVSLGLAG